MPHSVNEISLQNVHNARDMGGIRLRDGRIVKQSVLIRTGQLSAMTPSDASMLRDHFGVRTVIDLRNPDETAERPDPPVPGFTYFSIPLLRAETLGISQEGHGTDPLTRSIGTAQMLKALGVENYLGRIYSDIAKDPYCIAQFKAVMECFLCAEDGAVLFHCTSGKDRTGIVSAVLLHILGASEADIFSDYLHTNIQNRAYRHLLSQRLAEYGASAEEISQIDVLESVKREYLAQFFHIIQENFGTMDGFTQTALGVTPEMRHALRDRYSEPQQKG